MEYLTLERIATELAREAKKKKDRTQEVRDKKDPEAPLRGEVPKSRADSARMLAERGQAGSGRHKNKGTRGKGTRGKGKRQRHPKHKSKSTWATEKVARRIDYDAWRRELPADLSRRDELIFNWFVKFAQAEGVEARTLTQALPMVAWDMGYQGKEQYDDAVMDILLLAGVVDRRLVQKVKQENKKGLKEHFDNVSIVRVHDGETGETIEVDANSFRYLSGVRNGRPHVKEVPAEMVARSGEVSFETYGEAKRDAEEWLRRNASVRMASRKLDSSLRRKVNAALRRAGLDGNGRFEKPGLALSEAMSVLNRFGLELDEVPSSHRFKGQSGTVNIDIAFSNPTDPFSPEPITNSMLALQFTVLEPYRVETVAYLS